VVNGTLGDVFKRYVVLDKKSLYAWDKVILHPNDADVMACSAEKHIDFVSNCATKVVSTILIRLAQVSQIPQD